MRFLLSAITAVLLAGLTSAGFAQDVIPVQVDIDHASFAYSDAESLVELYIAIDASSLDYESETDRFISSLPVQLAIVAASTAAVGAPSDQAIWADSVLLRFAVPDTNGLVEGQHFIHQIRTAVQPGEYELRLTIPADVAGDRPELELRRDLFVPSFENGESPGLSSVTLATEISQTTDRTSPFYKNGLLVRPNANQLYGQGLERMYYYAEAYGTAAIAGSDGEYTVYTYISEANRPQPISGLERRSQRESRDPDVLVGDFDVSILPSGSYFLRIALLNDANESVAEKSRKFFVYNPGVQREQPPGIEMEFETSPYASMPAEEVEQSLEHITAIANDAERRRISRLEDLETKRRFLMEFWQKRDESPGTPINEFQEEFYRRLQYANDRYSSNRRQGWTTDRGRTILRYGLPSSVEPHIYDREQAPHEIWEYNNIPGEGRAMFVFADLTGFGDFELIHSTVPGERTLPNWRQELMR